MNQFHFTTSKKAATIKSIAGKWGLTIKHELSTQSALVRAGRY